MEKQAFYAEKLAAMIREKTVSAYNETDLSRFYRFHEVLKTLFPAVFSTCSVEDFSGSLLLCWKGERSDRPILFMNHFDVVEAGGTWEHDPFSGDIADGKIWGRGTVDTKTGLFSMLEAAEELMGEGFTPAEDIWFISTCTEECDSSGIAAISEELKKRGIHFEFSLDEGGLIVYDPVGGADGTFAMVAVGEKDCASLRFSVHSGGGHASRPGKNTPLVRLARFITAVEKARIFRPKLAPVTAEMFARLSDSMRGPVRFLLGHPRLFRPLLTRLLPHISDAAKSMVCTTIAFTQAGGSEAHNVMPQEAYVVGNMRFCHHQPYEESLAAIKKIADRYGVETEVIDPHHQSPVSDYRSDAFSRVEAAVSAVFPGVGTVPYISASASDNRFMGGIAENCFGFAPLRVDDRQLGGIHGLNENIDLSCLEPAVAFYKKMMEGHNNV